MSEDTVPRQLLHLVFGGELVEPGSNQFADLEKVHIVGVFPNYAEAYAAWRGATGATVDDAHVRYFIVHLHKLMDPAHEQERARLTGHDG
ncbi:MAG: DUF4170 domain-containing protein [Rhodospirillaceae bacterium]|nr:DUF4170 domain-containing protein [Rhodospirillaceae bacterium]